MRWRGRGGEDKQPGSSPLSMCRAVGHRIEPATLMSATGCAMEYWTFCTPHLYFPRHSCSYPWSCLAVSLMNVEKDEVYWCTNMCADVYFVTPLPPPRARARPPHQFVFHVVPLSFRPSPSFFRDPMPSPNLSPDPNLDRRIPTQAQAPAASTLAPPLPVPITLPPPPE